MAPRLPSDKHYRLRAHCLDAARGGDGAGSREQHGAEQMFGFLLIRSDDGRFGFDAAGESVAIGIEKSADVLLAGAGDEVRVEIGGNAGRKAAAKHEPGGGAEVRFDGGFDVGDFLADRGAARLR